MAKKIQTKAPPKKAVKAISKKKKPVSTKVKKSFPGTLQASTSNIKTHILRCWPGEDLYEALNTYMRAHSIKAAWIVSCVGSLTHANIRFAEVPEAKLLKGHFEIISLVGCLSGHKGSHVHICISDGKGTCIGGHLKEGNKVHTTAEIVIQEASDLEFVRVKDGATRYPELRIVKK
ncbi:hypothetical protein FGO68_gene13554 [Halteria grandinella]|uniref:PPC domain-containing protein n=1 Tax=Halteria grandinella TaxID=5974 RepID=A0A8J8SYB1_HALGN|nr:hypothetical protein FGO68_gene13554 [Halteria grandinella]